MLLGLRPPLTDWRRRFALAPPSKLRDDARPVLAPDIMRGTALGSAPTSPAGAARAPRVEALGAKTPAAALRCMPGLLREPNASRCANAPTHQHRTSGLTFPHAPCCGTPFASSLPYLHPRACQDRPGPKRASCRETCSHFAVVVCGEWGGTVIPLARNRCPAKEQPST